MKKTTILLTASIGIIAFASCSSKKDCVCTYNQYENGVLVSTSSTTTSNSTGGGPAVNQLSADNCEAGNYSSSSTSNGVTYLQEDICENE